MPKGRLSKPSSLHTPCCSEIRRQGTGPFAMLADSCWLTSQSNHCAAAGTTRSSCIRLAYRPHVEPQSEALLPRSLWFPGVILLTEASLGASGYARSSRWARPGVQSFCVPKGLRDDIPCQGGCVAATVPSSERAPQPDSLRVWSRVPEAASQSITSPATVSTRPPVRRFRHFGRVGVEIA